MVDSVAVRVPAKVNLALGVVGVRPDGFHELSTVFCAVGLHDEVLVERGPESSGVIIDVTGEGAGDVPRDESNIAARAARLIAQLCERPADVRITVAKSIPVAGGMAGGSADAAAVLLACDELWSAGIGRDGLSRIAVDLGSDVPFLLHGGVMLGSGRGEVLAPVLSRGDFHWVVAFGDGGLSTPAVYAEWDRLRAEGHLQPSSPDAVTDVLQALRGGDATALGEALRNDLEPAAMSLQPSLARTLAAGRELGALGGVVSGSGPTCVFLARDREHALDIAVGLTTVASVRTVRHVLGPVPGATIMR